MIEPVSIIECPAFRVLGIQERAHPMRMDYQALWARFEQRFEEVNQFSPDISGYGVYFDCDDCSEGGNCDIFAGMATRLTGNAPEGLVMRDVPGGAYAVFECDMKGITETWSAIDTYYQQESEYEWDNGRPSYECFPPGCHEGTAKVRIHVPVRRKS